MRNFGYIDISVWVSLVFTCQIFFFVCLFVCYLMIYSIKILRKLRTRLPRILPDYVAIFYLTEIHVSLAQCQKC